MVESICRKNSMPYLRMGSGEPLVLIHGAGERKEGWFKQFELAKEYDLIIPDLRGHGANPTTDGISIPNYAKDILSLLDELNIENAHICGLSMGGTVAQEIYRQAPERCQSLLLVSTFHYYFIVNKLGKFANLFRKARNSFFTSGQLQNIQARMSLYSCSKENTEALFGKVLSSNRETFDQVAEACMKIDNRELLPKIKVPTLIVGCQYDVLLPLRIQVQMHQLIPNSELAIFKNSGHIAKIEYPQEFNQTLRDFLRKHPIL
ncbi:alpha/beta fold hydrolase [Neobacillus sp. NRS-1170]|uniref:alpha/beta fold hydrolase n=1 Tax=Neobacillus sp. NRS-1170 TaxID=3233898 RepID=UPI003D283C7D